MITDRNDSYLNAVTALGTTQDKSQHTWFSRRLWLSDTILSDLYEQDAMAARIVDRVVDDSTREGFTPMADTDYDWSPVMSRFEDIGAMEKIADAWRWSRLYGGAVLVMIVDDGRGLDEEMAPDYMSRLVDLVVLESPYVTPSEVWGGSYGDHGLAEPTAYTVNLPYKTDSVDQMRTIHASRCIPFHGVKVPRYRQVERDGWGPSAIERVWEPLKRLGSAMAYAENMLHEASIPHMKVSGLRDQLCTPGGRAQVQEGFELFKWASTALKMRVIDSEDEIGEATRSVDGVSKIIDAAVDDIVRSTSMPRTVVLGEQPGGLGSAASSEIRAWFDHCHAQQKLKLTRPVNRILELLLREQPEAGPATWTLDWSPLWQPSEVERLQARKTAAESRALDIDSGIITEQEARMDPTLAEAYPGMDAEQDAPGRPGADPAEAVALEVLT